MPGRRTPRRARRLRRRTRVGRGRAGARPRRASRPSPRARSRRPARPSLARQRWRRPTGAPPSPARPARVVAVPPATPCGRSPSATCRPAPPITTSPAAGTRSTPPTAVPSAPTRTSSCPAQHLRLPPLPGKDRHEHRPRSSHFRCHRSPRSRASKGLSRSTSAPARRPAPQLSARPCVDTDVVSIDLGAPARFESTRPHRAGRGRDRGWRPPVTQVLRWTTPEVYQDLARRAHLVAAAADAVPGAANPVRSARSWSRAPHQLVPELRRGQPARALRPALPGRRREVRADPRPLAAAPWSSLSGVEPLATPARHRCRAMVSTLVTAHQRSPSPTGQRARRHWMRAVRPVGPPGAPWQRLYFLPEPQGHSALRPTSANGSSALVTVAVAAP